MDWETSGDGAKYVNDEQEQKPIHRSTSYANKCGFELNRVLQERLRRCCGEEGRLPSQGLDITHLQLVTKLFLCDCCSHVVPPSMALCGMIGIAKPLLLLL